MILSNEQLKEQFLFLLNQKVPGKNQYAQYISH